MESTRKRNTAQKTLNFERQGPLIKSVDESNLQAQDQS
jgi:hypothetical protein